MTWAWSAVGLELDFLVPEFELPPQPVSPALPRIRTIDNMTPDRIAQIHATSPARVMGDWVRPAER
jgi:hypothetical protein